MQDRYGFDMDAEYDLPVYADKPTHECSYCEVQIVAGREGDRCPAYNCRGIVLAIDDHLTVNTPQASHTQAAIDLCTDPVVKAALEERKLELITKG